MSQQAGIWHYDQQPVTREQLAAFDKQLTMQGPDNRGEYQEPGFAMLHRAFYITVEDSLETQPLRTLHGNVLTWDGRLDNRDELLVDLGRTAFDLPTDAEIVAAALAAWGPKALPRIIGDWALAWWNPRERRLLLARDYIGIRKLYHLRAGNSFYWSTDLAALVLHSGQRYTLCDPYFAGYFTNYPEPHLTPYDEIQLVPPGGYLEVTPEKVKVKRYWSFNRLPDIRYKTDAEYEEHFRLLFRQSVKRRMRTCYPILADLSGGLDSSSIVCMAYDILKAGEASATINTISYYSTDEPGGDERPYFMAIEEHIGKTGTHIESQYEPDKLLRPLREPYFAPLPGYFDRMIEGERRIIAETGHQGNRMHLRGLGGDELLGGVQNPIPDLAGLLWNLHLRSYLKQVEAWALQRKTTVWWLFGHTLIALMPIWLRAYLDREKTKQMTGWLWPEFTKRQQIAWREVRIVGCATEWLPGMPAPDSSYLGLAASIAGYLPRFSYAEQTGLPYYDREMMQFLFAIPGEQLLRAHQRRSLMRRALRPVVPDLVISRKTKALGRRAPTLELLSSSAMLSELLPKTLIAERYVSPKRLEACLQSMREGKPVPTLLLERVLGSSILCTEISFVTPCQRHTSAELMSRDI
jgi:asparagine synthase (glutamine-hydrolysing)